MKLKEVEIPEIPQFIADWVDNLKSGLFGLNYDSVPISMIGCYKQILNNLVFTNIC